MKNRIDLENVAVHVYSKYIGLRGVAMAFAVTFHWKNRTEAPNYKSNSSPKICPLKLCRSSFDFFNSYPF